MTLTLTLSERVPERKVRVRVEAQIELATLASKDDPGVFLLGASC